MALWYLLAFYGFVRGLDETGFRGRALSVAACAAGMMTKEVMVTAPVALFLFDWTCVAGSAREAWRRRRPYYLALGATWLLLAGLMLGANLGRRSVGVEHGLSRLAYLQIECRAVAHYLGIAFWPQPLIFDHGADLPAPSLLEALGKGAGLAALLGLSVTGAWRGRAWGFLGCAFFLLLAPTSSVIPVAGQPIAENRAYLPLAVALTAAVVGVQRAVRSNGAMLFAAALGAFGWLAHARNADFRGELSIWGDTVAKQPSNGRAWVYYSQALKQSGRPADALQALATAVQRHPDVAEPRNNLAVSLYENGRVAEAVTQFQEAIRLKPDYADAYYNFGVVLHATNNFGPALECFEASLRLRPGSVEAENYAGLCALRQQNFPVAVRHFQRALAIDPNHPAARANLAQALAARK